MAARKRLFPILAAVLLPGLAFGQGGGLPSPKVLLNSDPIGAEVLGPGGRVLGKTPLVLSPEEIGLIPGGIRTIRLRKDRFADCEIKVPHPGDGSTSRLVLLSPREASLGLGDFSADTGYILGYGPLDLYPNPEDGVLLPRIRPRYPRQDLLGGVRIALPFFLGVSALIAASDISTPRGNGRLLSWELAGSTLVSAGLFGADLWLSRDRRRFLQTTDPPRKEWLSTRSGAARAMTEARALMMAGAAEPAAVVLENLLAAYPDSVLAPEAIYLLGRLALQEGDVEKAARLLERVVEELPAAEVLDKACKSLADARALQGDLSGALEALDFMVYLDPSYPPRVIDLYRLQLRASSAQRP